MSVLLQIKFTGNLLGQRSISVKRDRLSEIIGNPIRKGEDPEEILKRRRGPCSEMNRKRDACNQADVDTEFRRGLPPIPRDFEYDARVQISRVLATPLVTTDSSTRVFYHGAWILTSRRRSRVNTSD